MKIDLKITDGQHLAVAPDGRSFSAPDIDQDLLHLARDGSLWEDEVSCPAFMKYLVEQGQVNPIGYGIVQYQAADQDSLRQWYDDTFVPFCRDVFETDLEPRYGITLNLTFGKGTKDIDIITLPDGQAFPAEDIDHDLVELSEDGAIWEDQAKVPGFLAYLEEQGVVKRVRQKGRPDLFQALDPEALRAWYHEGFLPACAEFFSQPEPDEEEERPIMEGIEGFCALHWFYNLAFNGTALKIPITEGKNPVTVLMELSVYLAGNGWTDWEDTLGDPEILLKGSTVQVIFPNLDKQ